jgi:ATP-dependent exoDNAse (exonuclease V) alpha subunit
LARRDSEKLRLTRTALPLRLAWALTVHRSQGMSLSKLAVHLKDAFGAGMVYVALSRCTSLTGLQVCAWLMGLWRLCGRLG